MSAQQECPECPGNGKLSWQEPAVIQLCHESEVSGVCFGGSGIVGECLSGNSALGNCDIGNSPADFCFGGNGF